MAKWRLGGVTPTKLKRAPKPGPKGSPRLQGPAPAVSRLTPGGRPTARPGGAPLPTPFMLPAGTPQWTPPPPPAAPVPVKDPARDLSWQDSGYNSAVANLLAQRDQGKSALLAAGRRAAEDRDRNVRLLGEGRGKQKVASRQSANRSGLFYSGTLGKNLGDIDSDYDRRNEDVNTQFTRAEQDRVVADAGLEGSFNQAQQTAAQQAIDRWINGAAAAEDATTPSLQALVDVLSTLNTKPNARGR